MCEFAMTSVARFSKLTLARVEARVPDLSLVDDFDRALLSFIEEKYGGVAPLGEINALAVIGALAPKWREMISLPQLGSLIPEDLMRTVSTGLAERELAIRLEKLERLGLIERLPGSDEGKGKIVLTDVGRAIAMYGGVSLRQREAEFRAVLSRLRVEIPPSTSYVLNPNEIVVALVREEIELKSREIGFVVPSPRASLLGIQILNNVIEGPYTGCLEIVLRGGYVPVKLETGTHIANLIILVRG